jgi:hypothetical protein
MSEFDRSMAWCGSSLAMVVFRRQFTELNDQYWAPLPTELLVRRFASASGDSTALTTALSVSGGNWQRVSHDVGGFVDKFKASRAWARLLTLVLLASSTELYFRNITRVARLSDPSLTPGFPKALDGVVLLKAGVNIESDSDAFSKGTWERRISSYEKSFGSAPQRLVDSASELDKMRRMRNAVAHEFGLDGDSHPYWFLSEDKAHSLSEKRLQKWLGVVDDVVRTVDAHLVGEFIGDFETLELLHLWTSDRDALMRSTGVQLSSHSLSSARPFMKYLAAATRRSPAGKQYWEGLNRYYRQA